LKNDAAREWLLDIVQHGVAALRSIFTSAAITTITKAKSSELLMPVFCRLVADTTTTTTRTTTTTTTATTMLLLEDVAAIACALLQSAADNNSSSSGGGTILVLQGMMQSSLLRRLVSRASDASASNTLVMLGLRLAQHAMLAGSDAAAYLCDDTSSSNLTSLLRNALLSEPPRLLQPHPKLRILSADDAHDIHESFALSRDALSLLAAVHSTTPSAYAAYAAWLPELRARFAIAAQTTDDELLLSRLSPSNRALARRALPPRGSTRRFQLDFVASVLALPQAQRRAFLLGLVMEDDDDGDDEQSGDENRHGVNALAQLMQRIEAMQQKTF
jgi:hypothetical protein